MSNNTLVEKLQNPTLYKHPIQYFKVIETHISYVLLTGELAYKIKKPVSLGFLDFSTLEKRKLFCEKEFQLNTRFTDAIYLGVVPIYGSMDNPNFEGKGDIIEYAVKMQEFPQTALLSALLKRNELTADIISELGKIIANFHLKAPVATDPLLGSAEEVQKPVAQNFAQIRPLLTKEIDLQQLSRLEIWANSEYQKCYHLLSQRKKDGFIRACHGDIHLENIIFLNNKPHIFDCIEFNEPFRWTDVIADIGFLVMDLIERNYKHYAYQLINEYFQTTKDYAGLRLLPYYISYRAIVRAKISLFRLQQPGLGEIEKKSILQMYYGCMALAEKYTIPAQPHLIIMHGVSASGKSTVAKSLAIASDAMHIRSDVERKNLFPHETSTAINQNSYSPQATKKTYQHLADLAKIIIQSGFSVIIDATFLKKEQRELFEKLANKLEIPFTIIACYAPEEILKESLLMRIHQNKDPSEATLEVLQMQLDTIEKLTDAELEKTIVIKTNHNHCEKERMNMLNNILERLKKIE